ncbi:6565_t:CDS:1 [Ambispora gerdemannii]|uniref:6565_t:CDS:1 n=1 Tax=Ambispora gerdemannii TaxID=144530 RepID=A0A9N8W019_9GLOM|nr:6565_t:CDS:1 [Ambispora gerdemannii]
MIISIPYQFIPTLPDSHESKVELESGGHLTNRIELIGSDVEIETKFQAGSNLEASAGARFGTGGIRANAKAGASLLRHNNGNGDIKFLNAEARAEVVMGASFTATAKAGINLINAETKAVKGNIGVNVDTGASIGPDGMGAKVAGFGITIGKEMGVSTPFGGISINLGGVLEEFSGYEKHLNNVNFLNNCISKL